jgi:single-strand DNA-binding protein
MFQEQIIIGNLGEKPYLRYTPEGRAVVEMSVATNMHFIDYEDHERDERVWFHVTAWNELAEECVANLDKGSRVKITGRLAPDANSGGPRVFKRKDGSFGARYEVVANSVKPFTRIAQPEQPSLLEPVDE